MDGCYFVWAHEAIKPVLSTYIRKFLLNLCKALPPLIHYAKYDAINVYNPYNHTKLIFSLNTKINSYAATISFNQRIFIIGGYIKSPTNQVYEASFTPNKLINKEPMHCCKLLHSLCYSGNKIYSVGGFNSQEYASNELYQVIQNKWVLLPNLNSPAGHICVFEFNNKYIYAYGGITFTNQNLNRIEKLSILHPKDWEILHISPELPMRRAVNALQISNNEVLLIGGIDNRVTEANNVLTIMNSNARWGWHSNLEFESYFCYSSNPVLLNGSIYAADSYRDLHVYCNKQWTSIKPWSKDDITQNNNITYIEASKNKMQSINLQEYLQKSIKDSTT